MLRLSEKLFPATSRYIGVIATAKDSSTGLLTKEAYTEMLAF